MDISCDFGASTTDVIGWNQDKPILFKTFESAKLKPRRLDEVFKRMKIDLSGLQKIFVTGGQSHHFPDHIDTTLIIKVNEIEAIGRGGWWLYKTTQKTGMAKKILVASLGTGTCLVAVKSQGKKITTEHLGGTGIGGGTFLGLTQALLKENDVTRLRTMFAQGDRRKVDISVEEIVGGPIGRVPAWGTASNLGKLSAVYQPEVTFSKNDLAAGIANLIGQTIATAAIFAARSKMISTIVLTGKLTRIKKIRDIIRETGRVYKIKIIIPKRADYVSAIGAYIHK